jgi:hypothetical protein
MLNFEACERIKYKNETKNKNKLFVIANVTHVSMWCAIK